MKKTKIVIAGGGFAGLYAAKYLNKRLARRPDIEVTLVSRENFILFTPMLHEVAAGDLSRAISSIRSGAFFGMSTLSKLIFRR